MRKRKNWPSVTRNDPKIQWKTWEYEKKILKRKRQIPPEGTKKLSRNGKKKGINKFRQSTSIVRINALNDAKQYDYFQSTMPILARRIKQLLPK